MRFAIAACLGCGEPPAGTGDSPGPLLLAFDVPNSSLQDCHVQFDSYNEPFLDTTGPFCRVPHTPLCLAGPTGEHPQGEGCQAGHGEGEGSGQERGTPRGGGQGGR